MDEIEQLLSLQTNLPYSQVLNQQYLIIFLKKGLKKNSLTSYFVVYICIRKWLLNYLLLLLIQHKYLYEFVLDKFNTRSEFFLIY